MLARIINYRIEKSIHIALACVLAFLIGNYFHFQNIFWSLITVLLLVQDYPEQILQKALLRITGTLCGAVFGLIIAKYTHNYPFLFLISIFLIATFAIYRSHQSRFSYAWMLGGITAFIVQIAGAINPANSLFIAIWRSAEVSLGCLIVLAIQFTMRERNSYSIFSTSLKKACSLVASEIEQLADYLQEPTAKPVLDHDELKTIISKCDELYDIIAGRRSQPPWLANAKNCLEGIKFVMEYLEHFHFRTEKENTNTFIFKKNMNYLLKKIATFYRNFNIQKGSNNKKLIKLYENVLNQYQVYRESGEVRHYPLTLILNHYHWLNLCDFLITAFTLNNKIPKRVLNKSFMTTRTLILKHSIKVGLACVISFYAWLYSGWYGGLSGIISSYIVSMQEHLGSSLDKARQRLLGCFIGGLIGVVAILFFTHTLAHMLIAIAIGTLMGGYFIHGKPNYSYLALQACFAYVITLIPPQGVIATAVPPALERLSGIFLGVMASLIVSISLWPAHPRRWLSEGIEKNTVNLLNFLNEFKLGHYNTIANYLSPLLQQQLLNNSLISQVKDQHLKKQTNSQQRLVNLCQLLASQKHSHDIFLTLNFPLQNYIEQLKFFLLKKSELQQPIKISDYLHNLRKTANTLLLSSPQIAQFLQTLDYLDRFEQELNK
ncbi:MAG: FUSC family protein [Legionellales bacterium]|nr:FUSC family protein [Legionellales bacterium]